MYRKNEEEEEKEENTLSSLPSEILVYGLCFLDSASLVSFHLTSKRYKTLIEQNCKEEGENITIPLKQFSLDAITLVKSAIEGGHFNLMIMYINPKYTYAFEEYFRKAASCGHLEMLNYFLETMSPSSSIYEIIADNATKHGHGKILELVYERFPKIRHYQLILENVVERGDYDLFCWCLKKGFEYNNDHLESAARCGHTQIIKYLLHRLPNLTELTSNVAFSGNLKLLKWLIKKRHLPLLDDASILTNAVRSGNFEMVKWLKSMNCPFESKTLDWAAYNGRLDILQWLHDNGASFHDFIYIEAAWGGNVSLFKYLYEEIGLVKLPNNISLYAAENGHIPLLEYLRSIERKECQFQSNTFSFAAKNGHLETLKWALCNGYSFPSSHQSWLKEAMENDHVHIVKWLEKYLDLNMFIKSSLLPVVHDGHIKVLSFMLNHESYQKPLLSFDGQTLYLEAIRGGQLDILKLLKKKGYSWNRDECLFEAHRYHKHQIYLWILNH